jgi:hypothetical protein
MMPSPIPMAKISSSDVPLSRSVLGMRSARMDAIGRFCVTLTPKSPDRKFLSQRTYWTWTGWSSP